MKLPLLIFFVFMLIGFSGRASAPSDQQREKYRTLTTADRVIRNVPDALPEKSRHNYGTRVPSVMLLHPTSRINTRYKEGIDVSRYQGFIDWNRVGAEGNISYVYIKATLIDPTYATNLYGARQAGLSVGSYHFYRPNADLEGQLANMTSTIIKSQQDLVPLIDIETTGGLPRDEFVEGLQEFVERVTAYYGRHPLLYTYQNFYNRYLVGTFWGYNWMIAKYNGDEPILTGSTDYIMWQYTQTGRIPGISTKVDRSRIMGTHSLSALQM